MKNLRSVLTLIFILGCSFSFAGQWININSNTPENAQVKLVSNENNTTVLRMNLSGFYKQEVKTPNGNAFKIYVGGATPILEKGNPDLPKISASIIIPDLASMKVEVISSTYSEFNNIEIAPSKGSLLRTIDPSTVAYTYSDVYNQNQFYPAQLSSLREPFIVRDFRGQTVLFNPFEYNPVTKTLRVYSELTVRISVENSVGGVNAFNRTKPLTSIDNEFAQIYNSLFKNGNNYINYTPVSEDGDMLIISYGPWMNLLSSFKEWKAQRGIHCDMVDVASIGNSDVAIKTYIQNYYSTHNLKYVLIVGDAQYVATPQMSGGASDPSYGYLVGFDSYAEVFVGRFSAESVADVQTQVQRSIDYELNPTIGGTWYKKAIGIASDLGPGDDNEMDWEHERNIRTGFLNYGFSDVDELYDGTHGIVDAAGDPGQADLVNAINNGRSVINYTGHGSQNSCATTGFSSGDVSALSNYGMLPFWWSVGCVHGYFDNGTCLAEALLREQDNGNPKGMVAALMSSVNQYWDEPMDGQDEFDSLLCDSYINNVKRTYGGISVNGCMHMNDDYGSTGYEMTDTWHCFGDPSLVVRNNTPITLTANHAQVLAIGVATFPVNCNIDGAVVTFTKGDSIYAVGTVAGGMVTLNFTPFAAPDTMTVTATAFNCIPYQGQVIVMSAAGINELNNGSNLSVFPNPVSDYALINFTLNKSEKISLKVFDEAGKLVATVLENSNLNKGKNEIRIETRNLTTGIYTLELMVGCINQNFKLVVKK